VTSKVKGYPFEVALPPGLPVSGVILADQIKSLDWKARKTEFVARTSASVIEDVLSLVLALLGEEP
jgi:mRNA interferase MazF